MADTIKYLKKLEPYVSPHKVDVIDKVLSNRTRKITVVLEDIYHAQNASAVLRTCECMGLQDVYVAENKNTFEVNPRVVQGSSKWITLHKFSKSELDNPIFSCIEGLRSAGYHICATSPSADAIDIAELQLSEKMAFVFGTELTGISDEVAGASDEFVRLPMYGFTDSYNLSVSVALVLQEIVKKYKTIFHDWQLSKKEQEALRLEWYRKIVRRSDLILELED